MPSNPLTQEELNSYAIDRILNPVGYTGLSSYMPAGYFLSTPPMVNGPVLWRLFDASFISSGIIDRNRLGTGSIGDGTKYLADDSTWKTISVPATSTLAQVTTAGNTTTNAISVGVLTGSSGVSQFKFNTGAGSVTPTLAIGNTDTSGKFAALLAGTVGSEFNFDKSGWFAIAGDTKANYTGNGLGSGSETYYLRIQGGTGNIQINTTTDAGYKLDVNGTVRVQGDTTVTGQLNLFSTPIISFYNDAYHRISYSSNVLTIREYGQIVLNAGWGVASSAITVDGTVISSGNGYTIYPISITAGYGQSTAQTSKHFYINSNNRMYFQMTSEIDNSNRNFNLGVTTDNLNLLSGTSITFGAVGASKDGTVVNKGNSTEWGKINSTGFAIGTTTVSAKLNVAGSVTASSSLAQGVYFNNTLVAAANSDVLVGLDINPTFTNGAFTGVNNYGLRINSVNATLNINAASSTTARLTTSSSYLIGPDSEITTLNGVTGNNFGIFRTGTVFGVSGYYGILFFASGEERMRIFQTGNVAIGTTVNAGYKLDVNGVIRATGFAVGSTTGWTGTFTVSTNPPGQQNLNIVGGIITSVS